MPTTPAISVAIAADDQSVRRSGPTTAYPPTGALARDDINAGATLQAQRTWNGTIYVIRNALLRFNTGAEIPDTATVTGCKVSAA